MIFIKIDKMEFFSPRFIGMRVTFTEGHAGTWVLTRKVSDTSSQYTESEFNLLDGASGAYGTFTCANINNTSEIAIMKVFMQ